MGRRGAGETGSWEMAAFFGERAAIVTVTVPAPGFCLAQGL